MPTNHNYWFPAKRYGWGWGLPETWQGWIVLILWFAALVAAGRVFIPRSPIPFLVTVAVTSAIFVLVCYLKGEPPRWRWGNKDSTDA